MEKKQSTGEKKRTMNVVLGLALLFFAVVLAVNGVRNIQTAAIVSAVVAICGVVLFGGVGIMLLVGEARHGHKTKE